MTTIAIAIEGPDKVGKATQSKMLYDAFVDGFDEFRTSLIEIPSKRHVCYDKIYDMLRRRPDGSAPAVDNPAIFQTFQAANRMGVQRDVFSMGDGGDRVIIFDRWVASSWVYGVASGVPEAELDVINDGLLTPIITFVLEGRGFDRPEEEDDAYEDDDSFQGKVRGGYKKWAHKNEHAFIINADRPKEDVCDEIFARVQQRLLEVGFLKGLNMKQLQRLEEREFYDVWEEEYEADRTDCPPTKMTVARNKCGEYIGEPGLAKKLCDEYGIAPEAREEGDVCIFGWSESKQKYYGWSHRALTGFAIGDEGIRTKEDARKAAMKFAESVS